MIILLGVFGTCLFISVWFIQGVNEVSEPCELCKFS